MLAAVKTLAHPRSHKSIIHYLQKNLLAYQRECTVSRLTHLLGPEHDLLKNKPNDQKLLSILKENNPREFMQLLARDRQTFPIYYKFSLLSVSLAPLVYSSLLVAKTVFPNALNGKPPAALVEGMLQIKADFVIKITSSIISLLASLAVLRSPPRLISEPLWISQRQAFVISTYNNYYQYLYRKRAFKGLKPSDTGSIHYPERRYFKTIKIFKYLIRVAAIFPFLLSFVHLCLTVVMRSKLVHQYHHNALQATCSGDDFLNLIKTRDYMLSHVRFISDIGSTVDYCIFSYDDAQYYAQRYMDTNVTEACFNFFTTACYTCFLSTSPDEEAICNYHDSTSSSLMNNLFLLLWLLALAPLLYQLFDRSTGNTLETPLDYKELTDAARPPYKLSIEDLKLAVWERTSDSIKTIHSNYVNFFNKADPDSTTDDPEITELKPCFESKYSGG